MGPDDPRAALGRDQMRRDRAAEPLMRLRRGDRTDEALARRADQQRQAEDASSSSRASAVMLCSGVLPKPMPGSSTMFSREMPALSAISSERAKKAAISFMMSMPASTLVAVVHDDDGRMARRHQPRHVGIALQAPDVVGDDCARIERPGDDGRFHAVDGDGNSERNHLGQDRPQALSVLRRRRPVARHRAGWIPRRCR